MKRSAVAIVIGVIVLATTISAEGQVTHSIHDIWRSYAQGLSIGSTVHVRTTAGDQFTGVVMVVDEDAITVKPRTRYPEPSRRILFDEVDDLQPRTQHPASLGKAVAIGAAVGGAVFLTLLLGLAGG